MRYIELFGFFLVVLGVFVVGIGGNRKEFSGDYGWFCYFWGFWLVFVY